MSKAGWDQGERTDDLGLLLTGLLFRVRAPVFCLWGLCIVTMCGSVSKILCAP